MTTEQQLPTPIRVMAPYDLTGIRDSGMRALVLLATSLGWNVLQRSGNPIVITARDGMQKRLPTNTSIRMSVFQTALSTIITHSQDVVPTVELIDRIVETVKLDRDHERRMRLAIGESAEEHKRRLATVPAAERKREPDEHLTQRIDLGGDRLPDIEFVEELPAVKVLTRDLDHATKDKARQERAALVRADHGELVSRKPFVAHHHTDAAGHKAKTYVSDTSIERVWEDGFRDYECVVCGQAYTTPRGAGAHSQVHSKRGEIPKPFQPAWKRATERGEDPNWVAKPLKRKTPKPEPVEEVTVADAVRGILGEPQSDAEAVLEAIIELVAPNLRQQRDEALAEVRSLREGMALLQSQYDKLDADWKALRDLVGGR